jgi:hypothetical protein
MNTTPHSSPCKATRQQSKTITTLVWFCEFPHHAGYFLTRDEAEWGKKVLINRHVTVPLIEGGMFAIESFEVEEYGGRFVLYCSGPFEYEPGKESTGEATAE